MAAMVRDLAIDLGTTKVSVLVRGEGLVLSEPSVVVRSVETGDIAAVGSEAEPMTGRTPAGWEAVQPIRGGAIVDFDSAEGLIRSLLQRAGVRRLARPRVVVCVPSAITAVEQRAVREAVGNAGATDVRLLGHSMAAALGCGLPLDQPVGSMVVDLGGGTTEAAVVSLGGMVATEFRRTGGLDLDGDVRRVVARRHRVEIGIDEARRLKETIGSALPPVYDPAAVTVSLPVRGRRLDGGAMAEVEVSATEVADAIDDRLRTMIDTAVACLGWVPPEIANDLVDTGVHLVGGGALLDGMGERLAGQVKIPVKVAAEPIEAAVTGAGRCLGLFERLDEIFLPDQAGAVR
jgi:rod shape-determining protein MreB